MNNKINPILYNSYLTLRRRLGASIVHRRRRKSSNCIEIVFRIKGLESIKGHLNPLKDAEKCGFWIMCRPQNKRGHTTYDGLQVYQLFLTPVHPKKRHEQARFAQEISFEPITSRPSRVLALRSSRALAPRPSGALALRPSRASQPKNWQKNTKKFARACVFRKKVVPLHAI